jgi:exosome complex exonuclease RRP6
MATLLSIFRPVPPVIRRRAKELLDSIRTTIKAEAMGHDQEEPVTNTSVVDMPNQSSVATAAVSSDQIAGNAPASSSHLWSHG